MSLKGSLETVALPEVLQLLAETGKSGELHVEGARANGRLWFESGQLSGFQVGRSDEAADALFELLRIESGDFDFEAEAPRSDSAVVAGSGQEDIHPILELAQARLAEWPEIVAVVPSLQHGVRLATEAPGSDVHVDSDQWALIVAIGEGRSVGDVLEKRDLREYFGCKALKALVDSSLVEVVEMEPAPEPVVEAPAPVMEIAEEVSEWVEPVPAEEHETGDDTVLASIPVLDAWQATPHASDAPEAHEDEAGAPDGDAPVSSDESDEDEVRNNARAEIEALLAEMAPHAEEEHADQSDAPVDGLEDRGPWTSSELASLDHMGGWRDDHEAAEEGHGGVFHPGSGYDVAVEEAGDYEAVVEHAEHAEHSENSEAAVSEDGQYGGFYEDVDAHADGQVEAATEPESESEEAQPAEEPINRGLLLKFLSSVRN